MNQRALAAEFIGTFMLMASVLGAAFYSFGAPSGAAGIMGVAFSIGLTVMALAFSIGHISGGHFNPAVTLGPRRRRTRQRRHALGYIIAQCLGAIAAACVFWLIGSTPPTFAANGYETCRCCSSGLGSVFLIETRADGLLPDRDHGATVQESASRLRPDRHRPDADRHPPHGDPGVQRLGQSRPQPCLALFGGSTAISQLWLFWVAPILGAVIGGIDRTLAAGGRDELSASRACTMKKL